MSNLLNAQQVKEQCSLVGLLTGLGYKPVPKRGKERMYQSMLRDNDNDPSFCVNEDLGVWFDHGLGKGGNIIDFGLLYWKDLGFKDVVRKIQQLCDQVPAEPRPQRPRLAVKIPLHIVEQVKPLGTHPAITNYLKSRGIFEVAKAYLSEIYYFVEDSKGVRKRYFAAGWPNENRSWEVRNRYFKGCLGHKGITFIPGHEKNAVIFEGFLDFLSWRLGNIDAEASVIVLNSLALLQQGIEKAKAFSSLDLFFDLDKAGKSATNDFLRALPYATDRSKAYEGFNDYNDKIMSAMLSSTEPGTKPDHFFSKIHVPFSR